MVSSGWTMNRKPELRFPPLYSAYSSAKIAGDFLPRIQYSAFDHFVTPFSNQ
jgi:hypothetical protein